MRTVLAGCIIGVGCVLVSAAEPCQSGPQPGQRTGEYASLISTGSERGQSHCYICDAGAHPSVIVFARSLSDPLAKLVVGLDKARDDYKDVDLLPWVTFLNADQNGFDPLVVAWAKKQGIRNVPLGIFEDVDGPPSYRLNREADVTVLINVKQHVIVNFSFRKGELTEEKVGDVLKEIEKVRRPKTDH
jgi:hypothetical protein